MRVEDYLGRLSRIERTILWWTSQGLTYRQMASDNLDPVSQAKVPLGKDMIQKHMTRVYRKLGFADKKVHHTQRRRVLKEIYYPKLQELWPTEESLQYDLKPIIALPAGIIEEPPDDPEMLALVLYDAERDLAVMRGEEVIHDVYEEEEEIIDGVFEEEEAHQFEEESIYESPRAAPIEPVILEQRQPPWYRNTFLVSGLVIAALIVLVVVVAATYFAGRELIRPDEADRFEPETEPDDLVEEPVINELVDAQTSEPRPTSIPTSTPPPVILPSPQKGVNISMYHDLSAGANGQILMEVSAGGYGLAIGRTLRRAVQDFTGEWRVVEDYLGSIYSNSYRASSEEDVVFNRKFEPGDYVILFGDVGFSDEHLGLNNVFIPKQELHTTLVSVNLGVLEVGVMRNGQALQDIIVMVARQTTDLSGNPIPAQSGNDNDYANTGRTDASGLATFALAEGIYAVNVWDVPDYRQWHYNIAVEVGGSTRQILEIGN